MYEIIQIFPLSSGYQVKRVARACGRQLWSIMHSFACEPRANKPESNKISFAWAQDSDTAAEQSFKQVCPRSQEEKSSSRGNP